MSVDIATFGGKKAIVLTNGAWAGKMSIGTNWTKLRIGMRLAFENSGANISSNNLLYVGVLSNPSVSLDNSPLHLTTSHFVGYRSAATFSYLAGTPNRYRLTGLNEGRVTVKVGSGETTAILSAPNYAFSADTSVWGYFFVELSKSGGNMTVEVLVNVDANFANADRDALFNTHPMSTMSRVNSYITAYGGVVLTGVGSTGTVAYNEGTNGDLNSICVAWPHPTISCYIADVNASIQP